MNWLNINLSTLRSPAYLGSSAVERATWLQALAYCVDQENGGRMAGAAAWKERQWQQACGVTAREVRAAARLLVIEGDDVCVAFYPQEKQTEVQARRIAATEAANRRWHGKLRGEANGDDSEPSPAGKRGNTASSAAKGSRHDAANDVLVDASCIAGGIASPTASCIAPVNAEEKEKEKKNKKENVTHPSPHSPSPEAGREAGERIFPRVGEVIMHGKAQSLPAPQDFSEWWWEAQEGAGWIDGQGRKILNWKSAFNAAWRAKVHATQERDARARQNAAQPGVPRAMSAYEINTKVSAIEEELGRLRQKARDGRSEDGLRMIKLYTPEQEARRGELLTAKDALKRKLTEVS